jgi:hypothetical protein
MAKRHGNHEKQASILPGKFRRDPRARRTINLELPEFLLCALEARVAEANADAEQEHWSTVNQYIETELVNLVTLRDVAELESEMPGFAQAVHNWLAEMRE